MNKQNFFQTKKADASGILEPDYEYLSKFPNPERFKVVKIETIETTTLDDEFNSKNHPHFIKSDTEGADLKILKAGDSMLDHVLGLVVECYFFNLHIFFIPMLFFLEVTMTILFVNKTTLSNTISNIVLFLILNNDLFICLSNLLPVPPAGITAVKTLYFFIVF